MTKSERKENDLITAYGCFVCRNHFGKDTPALIHHVRRLATSKKRDRAPKIGLCVNHHAGPFGVGVHSGRETWEKAFGSELWMAEVMERYLESRGLTPTWRKG